MDKIGRTIKRRRKENKTDYKARLRLLKSEKPRLVVRKTNRYIIGQVVVSDVAQDKVILQTSSEELLKNGWPEELKGSLKSLVAAYLSGYLLAKKNEKTKEAVLDIGIQRNIHKNRIYAFVKGAIDGGLRIPHKKEVLPDESLLEKNEKTGKLIKKIKEGLK